MQPEYQVTGILGAEVVEDGQGGGVEEFVGVSGGEGAGVCPGSRGKPIVQSLDESLRLELFQVRGVGGGGAMRAGRLEQSEVLVQIG